MLREKNPNYSNVKVEDRLIMKGQMSKNKINKIEGKKNLIPNSTTNKNSDKIKFQNFDKDNKYNKQLKEINHEENYINENYNYKENNTYPDSSVV